MNAGVAMRDLHDGIEFDVTDSGADLLIRGNVVSTIRKAVTEGRIDDAARLFAGCSDYYLCVVQNCSLDARTKPVHLRLANLYLRAGRAPEARQLLDRVRCFDPEFREVTQRQAGLGQRLLDQGKPADAIYVVVEGAVSLASRLRDRGAYFSRMGRPLTRPGVVARSRPVTGLLQRPV